MLTIVAATPHASGKWIAVTDLRENSAAGGSGVPPDGNRFQMVKAVDRPGAPPIRVSDVLNQKVGK